jgi:general stress protein YciG
MSAGITGTQPHTTNDNNSQANGNHAQPSQSEASAPQHQLTPDRPPTHPVERAAEGGEGKPKRPRGFAAMDRKLVSEIARKGGKAAHSAGTAHEFTSEEARVAGRKGGRATHAKRRKPSDEPETTTQSDEKPSS